MPILDGHKVDADQIDPCKHRYIGPWRHPRPPTLAEFERYPATRGRFCLCGDIIYTTAIRRNHWQGGCFDEPQYVTIQNEGSQ